MKKSILLLVLLVATVFYTTILQITVLAATIDNISLQGIVINNDPKTLLVDNYTFDVNQATKVVDADKYVDVTLSVKTTENPIDNNTKKAENDKNLNAAKTGDTILTLLIIDSLIISAVILAFLIRKKYKQTKIITMFAIVILSGLFVFNYAKAAGLSNKVVSVSFSKEILDCATFDKVTSSNVSYDVATDNSGLTWNLNDDKEQTFTFRLILKDTIDNSYLDKEINIASSTLNVIGSNNKISSIDFPQTSIELLQKVKIKETGVTNVIAHSFTITATATDLNGEDLTYEFVLIKPDKTEVSLGTVIGASGEQVSQEVTGLDDGEMYGYYVKVSNGTAGVTSPEKQDTTLSENVTDLLNNRTIKIGDYVDYSPDSANPATYSATIAHTGYTANQTVNKDTTLGWRILDIDGSQVRLISDKPSSSKFILRGADGYNNAVKLFNDICATQYSGSKGTAASLSLDDIEGKMTSDALALVNSDNKTGGNLTPASTARKYPNVWADEKISTINGVSTGTLGRSEQTNWYSGATTSTTSITTFVNCWTADMLPTYWVDNIYHTLFMNTGTANYPSYWLASRCVTDQYNDNTIHYCVNLMYNTTLPEVQAYSIYTSSGGTGNSGSYGVRPVITLNAGTKIDTTDTSTDGTTAAKAWILK